MSLLVHILQLVDLWDDEEKGWAQVEISMGTASRSTPVVHTGGTWNVDLQFQFVLEEDGENVLKFAVEDPLNHSVIGKFSVSIGFMLREDKLVEGRPDKYWLQLKKREGDIWVASETTRSRSQRKLHVVFQYLPPAANPLTGQMWPPANGVSCRLDGVVHTGANIPPARDGTWKCYTVTLLDSNPWNVTESFTGKLHELDTVFSCTQTVANPNWDCAFRFDGVHTHQCLLVLVVQEHNESSPPDLGFVHLSLANVPWNEWVKQSVVVMCSDETRNSGWADSTVTMSMRLQPTVERGLQAALYRPPTKEVYTQNYFGRAASAAARSSSPRTQPQPGGAARVSVSSACPDAVADTQAAREMVKEDLDSAGPTTPVEEALDQWTFATAMRRSDATAAQDSVPVGNGVAEGQTTEHGEAPEGAAFAESAAEVVQNGERWEKAEVAAQNEAGMVEKAGVVPGVGAEKPEEAAGYGSEKAETAEVAAEKPEVAAGEGSEKGEVAAEKPEVAAEKAEVAAEKPEVAAEKAEVAAEKPEVAAEKAEVAAEKPGVEAEKLGLASETPGVAAEKPEVAAEKPEVAAEKPEVSAEKPEVEAEKPEVSAEKPGVAAETPGVAAEKPEVVAEKAEVAAEKPEVAAEKAEVAAEKPGVAAEKLGVAAEKREVVAEKPEVAAEKPGVAAEKPGVAAEKPEVAAEKAEVAAEKPEVAAEKPEVAAEKPEVAAEKPEVAAEKPEVAAEKAEVAAEKPEVAAEKPEVAAEKPEVEQPEVAAETPGVAAEKPEVAAEKAEVAAEKPGVEAEKPEVAAEKPEVAAEKAEVAAEKPEVAAEKAEVAAEKPEVAAEKPEVAAEKPEVAAEKPEVAAEKAEVAAEKPEVAVEKPEVAAEKPEVAAEKPEVAAEKPEVAAEKPEVEQPEVAAEKPGVAAEKREVAAEKPEVAAEKAEVAAEKPGVAAEKPEVAAEKAEVAAEKPEVAAEKAEVAAEKPEVAAEKPEVAAEKPEVAAEKPEVAAEKAEVAAEKPEVAAEKPEVAAEKPEVAAEKPEVAAEKAEVAAEKPEEAAEKAEVAAEKAKVAAEKAEVAAEKPEVAAEKPEPAAEKPEVAAEKPEVAVEKAEVAAEKPEVAAEKREVAAEKPEEAAEKPQVAAEKPEVAAEKPGVAAEKPEVAAEKAEVAAEKPEVAAEKAEVAAEKPEVAAEKAEVAAEKPEVAAEKAEVAAEKPEVSDGSDKANIVAVAVEKGPEVAAGDDATKAEVVSGVAENGPEVAEGDRLENAEAAEGGADLVVQAAAEGRGEKAEGGAEGVSVAAEDATDMMAQVAEKGHETAAETESGIQAATAESMVRTAESSPSMSQERGCRVAEMVAQTVGERAAETAMSEANVAAVRASQVAAEEGPAMTAGGPSLETAAETRTNGADRASERDATADGAVRCTAEQALLGAPGTSEMPSHQPPTSGDPEHTASPLVPIGPPEAPAADRQCITHQPLDEHLLGVFGDADPADSDAPQQQRADGARCYTVEPEELRLTQAALHSAIMARGEIELQELRTRRQTGHEEHAQFSGIQMEYLKALHAVPAIPPRIPQSEVPSAVSSLGGWSASPKLEESDGYPVAPSTEEEALLSLLPTPPPLTNSLGHDAGRRLSDGPSVPADGTPIASASGAQQQRASEPDDGLPWEMREYELMKFQELERDELMYQEEARYDELKLQEKESRRWYQRLEQGMEDNALRKWLQTQYELLQQRPFVRSPEIRSLMQRIQQPSPCARDLLGGVVRPLAGTPPPVRPLRPLSSLSQYSPATTPEPARDPCGAMSDSATPHLNAQPSPSTSSDRTHARVLPSHLPRPTSALSDHSTVHLREQSPQAPGTPSSERTHTPTPPEGAQTHSAALLPQRPQSPAPDHARAYLPAVPPRSPSSDSLNPQPPAAHPQSPPIWPVELPHAHTPGADLDGPNGPSSEGARAHYPAAHAPHNPSPRNGLPADSTGSSLAGRRTRKLEDMLAGLHPHEDVPPRVPQLQPLPGQRASRQSSTDVPDGCESLRGPEASTEVSPTQTLRGAQGPSYEQHSPDDSETRPAVVPQAPTPSAPHLSLVDVAEGSPLHALRDAQDAQWLDDHRLVVVTGAPHARKALYLCDAAGPAAPVRLDVDLPDGAGTPVLAASPAARRVALGVGAHVAVVELAPAVRCHRRASPGPGPVRALAFCPSGARLAVGHDGYGCVWDLETLATAAEALTLRVRLLKVIDVTEGLAGARTVYADLQIRDDGHPGWRARASSAPGRPNSAGTALGWDQTFSFAVAADQRLHVLLRDGAAPGAALGACELALRDIQGDDVEAGDITLRRDGLEVGKVFLEVQLRGPGPPPHPAPRAAPACVADAALLGECVGAHWVDAARAAFVGRRAVLVLPVGAGAGPQQWALPCPTDPHAAAVADDGGGRGLVVAMRGGGLYVVHPASPVGRTAALPAACGREIAPEAPGPALVAVAQDGHTLYLWEAPQRIRVYDMRSVQLLAHLQPHAAEPRALRLSPGGTSLLLVTADAVSLHRLLHSRRASEAPQDARPAPPPCASTLGPILQPLPGPPDAAPLPSAAGASPPPPEPGAPPPAPALPDPPARLNGPPLPDRALQPLPPPDQRLKPSLTLQRPCIPGDASTAPYVPRSSPPSPEAHGPLGPAKPPAKLEELDAAPLPRTPSSEGPRPGLGVPGPRLIPKPPGSSASSPTTAYLPASPPPAAAPLQRRALRGDWAPAPGPTGPKERRDRGAGPAPWPLRPGSALRAGKSTPDPTPLPVKGGAAKRSSVGPRAFWGTDWQQILRDQDEELKALDKR